MKPSEIAPTLFLLDGYLHYQSFLWEVNMLYIIKDLIIIGISIYLGMLIERIRRDIRELRDFDDEDDREV